MAVLMFRIPFLISVVFAVTFADVKFDVTDESSLQ
jgi:hypothetical protein